jgi:GH15 family glucan-1,4-alpha-glucosidase
VLSALADLLALRAMSRLGKRPPSRSVRLSKARGWDPALGAFTQSFDSEALDATALLIPILGFLPPDDARVASSIDAVRDQLTDGRGLVHRYQTRSGVDGLAGEEGTFLLCTFWLAHALALSGRIQEGTEVFARAASYANEVGLLAEEVDSNTGSSSGTSPRPSVTSVSSTPPGRSTGP